MLCLTSTSISEARPRCGACGAPDEISHRSKRAVAFNGNAQSHFIVVPLWQSFRFGATQVQVTCRPRAAYVFVVRVPGRSSARGRASHALPNVPQNLTGVAPRLANVAQTRSNFVEGPIWNLEVR